MSSPKKIKKIILYIGSHKTGSTSIQKFLEINRIKLEQADIISKKYFGNVLFTHDMLNVKCEILPRERKFLSSMQCETLILSSENYSWLDSEGAENLISELREYTETIDVILYIRRQDKLATSQKQEGTKWVDNSIVYGHELSALPSELTPAAYAYLDFNQKVLMWDKLADQMIVQRFELARFFGACLIRDFLHALGLGENCDFAQLEIPDKMNESISREKQLFLHKIHPYFPDESLSKNLIWPIVSSQIEGDNQKLLPSQKQAKDFYAQFESSNHQLAEFLGLEGSSPLFDDNFNDYPDEANNAELSTEDICLMFSKIINVLASSIPAAITNNNRHVDAIRDIAISRAEINTPLARDLMQIAHEMRPSGVFIKQKLEEYKRRT